MTERGFRGLTIAALCSDVLLRVVAGVILLTMMMLTVVDVVMRYWFDSSIAGAFEITQLLLVVLIFAGFPLVSKGDHHVTVDLFEGIFGDRGKRILEVVKQAICTVVLGTMSWLLWSRINLVLDYHDVTAVLRISIVPFVCFMFALTVVTTMIHLSKLIQAVGNIGTRGSDSQDVSTGNRCSARDRPER